MNKSLISKVLGVPERDGCLFGLEIEVDTPDGLLNVDGWNREHDGSLREGGYEYVLEEPMSSIRAINSYTKLYEYLKGHTVRRNGRAGTHIHVNVSDMTCEQVITFFGMLVIYEQTLIKMFDEDRHYNYFALPFKDCEGYMLEPIKFLKVFGLERVEFWHTFGKFKYSNISLYPINNKGTIEIRGMHSVPEPQLVREFLQILRAIRKQSLKFTSLRDAIESFSMNSVDVYYEEIFGCKPPEDEDHPMNNLRAIMPLAYAEKEERNNFQLFVDEYNDIDEDML